MTGKRALASALVLAGMVLSACGGAAPAGPAPAVSTSAAVSSTAGAPASASSTAASSAPAKEAVRPITIGLASEPNTLDPHDAVGRNTEIFLPNIYDSLLSATRTTSSSQLWPSPTSSSIRRPGSSSCAKA